MAIRTAKMKRKAGPEFRSLHPKLRLIANGSTIVNTVRAECSAAVKVTSQAVLKQVPELRGFEATPLSKQEFEQNKKAKLPKRGSLNKKLATSIDVNVFIHKTTSDPLSPKLVNESARRGRLSTATISLTKIDKLAADPGVSFVELGEALKIPKPIVSAASAVAPPKVRANAGPSSKHKGGAGVLIGIVDVQGFDFSHPDFLNAAGGTRFHSIWDQGGSARPAPKAKQFAYGAEFTQAQMNAAIKAAATVKVPAFELERQSQLDPGAHGTHVASIAAGNHGICPNAVIAGVLIDLPKKDLDRRSSFYDSTRLADAIDYLFALGSSLKLPVSINVSLGTNGHAHDTSSAINRWIDAGLNTPGRCVSVAAGNAGQSRLDAPQDNGWLLGQIHSSSQVAKAGLVVDLEWGVVGNGLLDVSENELELWYGPQDRFAISVRPPGMDWIDPVEPGSFIENRRLPDGSFISIYNELYHPANGSNYISVFLTPLLSQKGVIGIPAGTWLVRIYGREVRDGHFHAWIERDDPMEVGPVGPRKAWRFPSFFTDKSNVDNSSVSSLACGERVISVANFDEPNGKINVSSSQGPTRDGRFKPDVAAPGTEIVAANGFAGPNDRWVAMTGTSMACPYVTGVCGLMLATQSKLTAAQIRGILLRTSKPLPGNDYLWRTDAGFGRIDPEACVKEADKITQRMDVTGQ